jgi:hypothetical protein
MDVFSPRQGTNAPGRARVLLAGTALSASVALLVLADRPAASSLTLNATSETVRIESVERHALDRHGSHVGHGGAATEIHVVVRVENRTDRAIPYSPGQFRLRRGNAPGTVAPVQTRVVTGGLGPGDELRERLAFRVPKPVGRLSLTFDDLERSSPLELALASSCAASPDHH